MWHSGNLNGYVGFHFCLQMISMISNNISALQRMSLDPLECPRTIFTSILPSAKFLEKIEIFDFLSFRAQRAKFLE